jgi:GntR family transcriptional regulator
LRRASYQTYCDPGEVRSHLLETDTKQRIAEIALPLSLREAPWTRSCLSYIIYIKLRLGWTMAKVNSKKPGADEPFPDQLKPVRASDLASPLYQVVKQQITEAIMVGQWPAGTVLPNEIALARMFGVAHGTLRRALMDLTNEGLLSRRRKIGTVVTGRTPQHSLRFFFQYFRLHGVDGSLQHAVPENLSLTRSAPTDSERALLFLEDSAEVIRFQRIRRVEGVPVMHDRFVLSADWVPDFPTAVENVPPLLYQHLLEHYGLRISAVREQLSAEPASAEIAAVLGIEPGCAVLVIDEVAYDQSNRPVIVASHHAVTTNHRYINEIQ